MAANITVPTRTAAADAEPGGWPADVPRGPGQTEEQHRSGRDADEEHEQLGDQQGTDRHARGLESAQDPALAVGRQMYRQTDQSKGGDHEPDVGRQVEGGTTHTAEDGAVGVRCVAEHLRKDVEHQWRQRECEDNGDRLAQEQL